MKLKNINFELIWPQSIQLIHLREFILQDLSKKGEVIRWSIQEIKIREEKMDHKILIINAAILV